MHLNHDFYVVVGKDVVQKMCRRVTNTISLYKLPNYTVINNFEANCFERFKLFKWNIYFVRAEFTPDLKKNKCLYICFEIKGKFCSNKKNISLKGLIKSFKTFTVKVIFNSVYMNFFYYLFVLS